MRAECKECSICKSKDSLEVHHIVPRILGGTNDRENLIVLCHKCHRKAHEKDHSTLTKIGIAKCKTEPTEPLIPLFELYKEIDEQKPIFAHEVVEIINDMIPHLRHRTIKDPKIIDYISNF